MHAKDNINVRMIQGLPGFEDHVLYTLKTVPGNPFFYWLEGSDGKDCPSFLLTKPESFFPDYIVQVKEDSIEEMGSSDDISVYLILTVPEDYIKITANLMAPLLINEERGLGYQVVLHDSQYMTRHNLFPQQEAL